MFSDMTKESLTILGLVLSFGCMFLIWLLKWYNDTIILASLFPFLICLFIAFVLRRD